MRFPMHIRRHRLPSILQAIEMTTDTVHHAHSSISDHRQEQQPLQLKQYSSSYPPLLPVSVAKSKPPMIRAGYLTRIVLYSFPLCRFSPVHFKWLFLSFGRIAYHNLTSASIKVASPYYQNTLLLYQTPRQMRREPGLRGHFAGSAFAGVTIGDCRIVSTTAPRRTSL